MSGPKPHPCGTRAGYRRHLASGATPCEPCTDAARAYNRARDPQKKRLQHRARSRAYTLLRREFPDEWFDLYDALEPGRRRPGDTSEQTRSRVTAAANRALARAHPTDWVICHHLAQAAVAAEHHQQS